MYRNQCTAKEKLMNRINEVSFAVNDVLLYLDTGSAKSRFLFLQIIIGKITKKFLLST